MLNQSFDVNSLLKLTRKKEIIKYSLGRDKDDYLNSLSKVSLKIKSTDFTFNEIPSFIMNKKTVFYVDDVNEYYAIKKIADNLKRLYRVKFSSRDNISEQVLKIIEDPSCYRLIRVDIKSFFESIKIQSLVDRIKKDGLLSYESRRVLMELLKSIPSSFNGLPRGLPLSSVLSEIFIEDVDKEIKSLDSVYYYARYVDDIIIITHGDDLSLNKDIIPCFKRRGLDVNEKTAELIVRQGGDYSPVKSKDVLSFLGYEYEISNRQNIKNKRKVTVKLSRNKINKIKTRIVKAVLSYGKGGGCITHNHLFILRIKFLSGNYELFSDVKNKNQYYDDMGKLKGGIYYGNKLVSDCEHLLELNKFLRSTLFCTRDSSLGKAVQRIPISTRRQAAIHCFREGFVGRVFWGFSEEEFKEISECWK